MPASKRFVIQILAITALLSLKFLLNDNMGRVNELDVLPFARQYVDPDWIPSDWYLTRPVGYRVPFNFIFGHMAKAWGFLAASIVGRLSCYAFIASGFVLIGRKLGLNLRSLLVAIGLFIYTFQSAIAQEWIIRGLETKMVAYGFLLLAIWLMLSDAYYWMALMLGLATTFHILVGGWAFLVVLVWLGVRRSATGFNIRRLGWIILIYLVSSSFPIWVAIQHLSLPSTAEGITTSYIYVFLRAHHHLHPLSWASYLWLKPLAYWLLFYTSLVSLKRHHQASPHYAVQVDLAWFTGLTWLPFAFGLLIAPFDTQGKLLQYYPFRLGDTMLPLSTYLLGACALQQFPKCQWQQRWTQFSHLFLGLICTIQIGMMAHQISILKHFPVNTQAADLAWYEVNPEWLDFCTWVRTQTPQDAIVVSPPVEFANFTWLSERGTIAKYRFVPSSAASVLDWYERINDLGGNASPWERPMQTSKADKTQALTLGYSQLTTAQAQALMIKYKATYFMTRTEHQLELEVAHKTPHYVLYQRT